MLNTMLIITFSISDWKYPFWTSLAQKKKRKSPIKLKLGTQANANKGNLIGMLTLFSLDGKLGQIRSKNLRFFV